MNQELRDIIRIAQEAGERILEIYHSDDFNVEYKQDESPLTKADLAAHRHIQAALQSLTPEIPILSEESKGIAFETRQHWERFWLVDPLDGTKEFIKRNDEFTVNIALIDNGAPILGVVHVPAQQLTFAADDTGAYKSLGGEVGSIRVSSELTGRLKVVASRSHAGPETTSFLDNLARDYSLEVVSKGSALKLCLVAEGSADLYPRLGPTMEWDTAAAQCVVEQAGGQVTKLDGFPLRYNKRSLLNPQFMVASAATSSIWQQYLPTYST